jgi:hypothetical protein
MKRTFIPAVTVFTAVVLSASPGSAGFAFDGHVIGGGINAWYAIATDLDGDGDLDVVASGRLDNRVLWWENDGTQGFTRHLISETSWPAGIDVVDLDDDGDPDVVAALQGLGEVVWYENRGSGRFTEHNVHNLDSATFVHTADLDSDGDTDVLAAACEFGSNKIAWYENDGRESFTEHIIKQDWDHANSIIAADVDSDGDMDVVATASRAAMGWGEIAWFENDGNQGLTEHTLSTGWGMPSSVSAADLDGDGDTDILASVCSVHKLVWFENNGEEEFTRHTITEQFRRPHVIRTVDFDGDGDMDVLGAAINSGEIARWENDGRQNFSKHVVSDTFEGASDVRAVDFDLDGDLDLVTAGQYGEQVAWWERHRLRPSPRRVTGRHSPSRPQSDLR